MFKHCSRRFCTGLLAISALTSAWLTGLAQAADPPLTPLSPPVIHKVQSANDRLEMTVNSSRLLTLDQKIPRAQVNNKDIADLTPLAPNVIQIFAKKAGVTQVNLWDEHDQIFSVDVVVVGDARELSLLLQSQFPHAAIKVQPSANSVILSGFVPEPEQVTQIVKIAEDYYPKVINALRVGGVQEIMLHVKVFEVSRTKLRNLGFDFTHSNGGSFFGSSISGLLDAGKETTGSAITSGAANDLAGDTMRFGIVSGSGNTAFFGFIDAMRKYSLAKVIAEPTLVTMSGRPAKFNDGGEIPILEPGGLGTTTIDWKNFGTEIDFVPIVYGNGGLRLEVKPRVTQLDYSIGVTIPGSTSVTPGLDVREVDTGVEMRPGQTLAIAGLLYKEVDYTNTGIPVLADLPWFGAAFRSTSEQVNEKELLILVTPELVDAMNPGEVPPCEPGSCSVSPNDAQFYGRGYPEVPACGPCGANWCGSAACAPNGVEGVIPPPGKPITPAPAYDGPRSSSDTGSVPLDPNQPILFTPSSPSNRANPQNGPAGSAASRGEQAPGFVGPIGYDVLN
ncbi:MAG TPA: pilus assembly protein N-terminal domain-containing protein [Pirellulales bacterium]|jgi:pilus assembly protein CpaC|nr:pilus assembly protein N-terminal domain-containing protein [Pirellulales bacterium]